MTGSTTTSPPAGAAADQELGAREAQRRDTQERRRQLLRRMLVRIIALVVFLGVWWLITSLQLIKPLYLPSPASVWHAFVLSNTDHPIAPGVDRMVKGEQNYYLWEHLIASLQRIGVGVGWAVIFGPILGFAMASFKPIATIIEPYLNFLRALPPLGYIGILIVWFGIGDTSKMWLLFLAAFPPITIATINGVRGVREERINGALSLGASRFQTITHVDIALHAARSDQRYPHRRRVRMDHRGRGGAQQRYSWDRRTCLPFRYRTQDTAHHRLHHRDRYRCDSARPGHQGRREGTCSLARKSMSANLSDKPREFS